MSLRMRNQEADRLARELARIFRTNITKAVISALRDAIRKRIHKESPHDTAQSPFQNLLQWLIRRNNRFPMATGSSLRTRRCVVRNRTPDDAIG